MPCFDMGLAIPRSPGGDIDSMCEGCHAERTRVPPQSMGACECRSEYVAQVWSACMSTSDRERGGASCAVLPIEREIAYYRIPYN